MAARDPEQAREYHRKWREANREKHLEARRKWEAANRDKVIAAKQAWRKDNPDKVKGQGQRYRKKHPEAVKYTEEELTALRAKYAANTDGFRDVARSTRARYRLRKSVERMEMAVLGKPLENT